LLTGSTFAFLSALAFALSTIYTRRAVIKDHDIRIGLFISLFVSLPFFLLILFASGQIESILHFTWDAYAWLTVAGLLHFILGRWLYFKCVQLVGGNVASILRRVDSLVALFLGVTFLDETLSIQLFLGILLIVFGVSTPGFDRQMFQQKGRFFSNFPPKALIYGFGTGIVWGTTPILMKMGLRGPVSPVAATFIAFLAATTVLGVPLLSPRSRTIFHKMTLGAIGLYCVVGLFAGVANLFRFLALNLSPASVITPLLSTTPVFLLILSFVFNRKLEIFNTRVVIGTVLVVIGTIFLV